MAEARGRFEWDYRAQALCLLSTGPVKKRGGGQWDVWDFHPHRKRPVVAEKLDKRRSMRALQAVFGRRNGAH